MAILPWEAWMYSNTGKVVVLSSGGVESILDGLTFALVPDSDGNYRQAVTVPQDVAALMQDIHESSAEIKSLDGVISVITGKLRTQPLTMAKLFVIKAARSWYGTASGRFETPIMLIQSVYLAVVLWCSGVAWKRGGVAKELTISIWLMVLYFWGMTVLVLSILRYIIPVMGLLFLLIPASFTRAQSATA